MTQFDVILIKEELWVYGDTEEDIRKLLGRHRYRSLNSILDILNYLNKVVKLHWNSEKMSFTFYFKDKNPLILKMDNNGRLGDYFTFE